MDNTCICCGAIIPEGRMVCPACEAGQTPKRPDTRKHEKTKKKVKRWRFF